MRKRLELFFLIAWFNYSLRYLGLVVEFASGSNII